MASTSEPNTAKSPVWPVALKVVALCVISFVALLLLLPAPPGGNSGGGITKVQRYTPPPLRETVDPLARAPETRPVPPLQESVSPVIPTAPSVREDAPATRVVAPVPAPPLPLRKPAAPVAAPVAEIPPPALTVPEVAANNPAAPPAQPYPESPSGGASGPLPSRADIRDWMRSQAWEFLGGVDAEGNILYRFEVWLQAPATALSGIRSVTYEYIAPSATPKVREAVLAKGGFRARFGALACSNQVKITIKMNDGGTQEAVADGCRALN